MLRASSRQDPNGGAPEPTLEPRLSLALLTLYGLGTTVGAGIYVLLGSIVGRAGYYAPLSFLIAAALAGLAALAFAEMAGRYPRSAGQAIYVSEGLGSTRLGLFVGLAIATAGLVSSATIVVGFVGYLQVFLAVPAAIAIVVVVALLTAISTWGILQSAVAAGAITLIECGGLLAVVLFGVDDVARSTIAWPSLANASSGEVWVGVIGGAMLAFFAFIGFEDMVNVAEEVERPAQTMPAAIGITLFLTALLYLALAVIAVAAVPLDEIAGSPAPLAMLFERVGGGPAWVLSLVGVFAVLNGALVQMIMVSRVLYGLAALGHLPKHLKRIGRKTKTPVRTTALAGVGVALLALFVPLTQLAEAASWVTLTVFALVNLALWRLKARGPLPAVPFSLPLWVPAAGFLCSVGFLLLRAVSLLA